MFKRLANEFIEGVEDGSVLSCKWVKLAVKRHLNDLKRQRSADFPYYFDEAEAQRKLTIISLMRHTKGEAKGKQFNLQGWQAFIYWVVYGWKRADNDKRRFRKVYIEIARKNGKTEMMAPACLNGLIFDQEGGAEVYTAATKKEQANILFGAAHVMAKYLVQDSPGIRDKLKIQKYRVEEMMSDSYLVSVGADHNTMDGFNPHVAVIDEYHAHKDDNVLKVMETGMGARTQPLLWVITTAGFNRYGPCYKLRTVGQEILETKKTDESFFSIIFTLDEGDNWEDEKVWVKSNPGLGITPNLEYMRGAYQKAKNEGETARVQFLTKNLNVWVDAAKTWIPGELWDKLGTLKDRSKLKGRPCYAGLDVGSSRDLTAFALFFPALEPDEKHKLIAWHFCPEDVVRIKADAVGNYKEWMRSGEMITTPGNVIDDEAILQVIREAWMKYDIKFMGYDRAKATHIVTKLISEGYDLESFGQGYVSMNVPTEEFEKMIFGKQLEHEGSSLMAWQLGNVEIQLANTGTDTKKPTKKQDDAKIDAIVASIMAVGTYLNHKDEFIEAGIDFG